MVYRARYAQPGACAVTAKLPKRNGEYEYRVRNSADATARPDPSDSLARPPADSTRGSILLRIRMGRRVKRGDDAGEWANMTGARWNERLARESELQAMSENKAAPRRALRQPLMAQA